MLSNEVHTERLCVRLYTSARYKTEIYFGLKDHMQESNLHKHIHTNLFLSNKTCKKDKHQKTVPGSYRDDARLIHRLAELVGSTGIQMWRDTESWHKLTDATYPRCTYEHSPCFPKPPLLHPGGALSLVNEHQEHMGVWQSEEKCFSFTHIHAYTDPSHRRPKWDLGLQAYFEHSNEDIRNEDARSPLANKTHTTSFR